jgi:hypothetical protein
MHIGPTGYANLRYFAAAPTPAATLLTSFACRAKKFPFAAARIFSNGATDRALILNQFRLAKQN